MSLDIFKQIVEIRESLRERGKIVLDRLLIRIDITNLKINVFIDQPQTGILVLVLKRKRNRKTKTFFL